MTRGKDNNKRVSVSLITPWCAGPNLSERPMIVHGGDLNLPAVIRNCSPDKGWREALLAAHEEPRVLPGGLVRAGRSLRGCSRVRTTIPRLSPDVVDLRKLRHGLRPRARESGGLEKAAQYPAAGKGIHSFSFR